MIESALTWLTHPGVLAPTLVVLAVLACVRVVYEYERAVLFRLGRAVGVREPGLVVVVPLVHHLRRVDLRLVSVDVARQETMTRDNVPVLVDAVIYFRVVDPSAAVLSVENHHQSTYLIAQTSLRSAIGQATLDDLLQRRDELNARLRDLVDRQTLPWGVQVPIVEVKDVSIPEDLKRAIAREAEVERERRARLIQATAEAETAEKLRDAARVLAEVPEAMQLRTLQALSDTAQGKGRVVVLPVPGDFFPRKAPEPARQAEHEDALP